MQHTLSVDKHKSNAQHFLPLIIINSKAFTSMFICFRKTTSLQIRQPRCFIDENKFISVRMYVGIHTSGLINLPGSVAYFKQYLFQLNFTFVFL